MSKPSTATEIAASTRNFVAVAAWNRNGGKHGGNAKTKNRRDRKSIKQELRA